MPANPLDNSCNHFNACFSHFKSLFCLILVGALSFNASAQEAADSSHAISAAIEGAVNSDVDVDTVDINTASASELATLVNIGLKKAKEIIAFREANGEFISIDDLTKVKGIGLGTVEKNRHRIQTAKK